ncbi:uncharacterized protein LOC134841629 [Symsagittifera roscoffensis]|uniref:uncharacterized protein LOC134841629 n=1 Tax=Symsagittifera roscoffensis TaxID=84072 RepID=UPI00307BE593
MNLTNVTTTEVPVLLKLTQWTTGTNAMRLSGFVVSVLGLVGNFLCYITANELPASNSAFLMKHLAVWDSIGGFTDGFTIITTYFNWWIANTHLVVCILFRFHTIASSLATGYFVVAMSVDRVVAIKFPFLHRSYSSSRVAAVIAATVVIVSYALSSGVAYFSDMDENGQCGLNRKSMYLVHTVYAFVGHYFVFFGVPFTVLVSANIIFVHSLRNRKKATHIKTEFSPEKFVPQWNLI